MRNLALLAAASMLFVASGCGGDKPAEAKTVKMFEKVDLILDERGAEFVDAHTVAVGDRKITARRIFIAVGTKPAAPPIPGLDGIDYLTNENVFHLESVPGSMTIIGGGAIGCEMAQAFNRLGCKTTIVHMDPHLVPIGDPEAGALLEEKLKARSLIESAIEGGVQHFIFSSTAAVYGDPESNPVTEDESLKPVSPYGRSKLMVEWMLQDAAKAHGLRYAVLRYFNVAGADPKGRTGQSTANATHLIKVAVQAALGHRAGMDPPQHSRMRALVSRGFTPRRVAELEPRIRELSILHLDKLVGRDDFDITVELCRQRLLAGQIVGHRLQYLCGIVSPCLLA